MGRGQTWEAHYASTRGMWWLYGGVLAAAIGSAAVFGAFPHVAQSLAELREYAWVAYLLALGPVLLLLTATMLPRRASIRVDPLRVSVARGRKTIVLQRQKLRITTQRWEHAPGAEVGSVLVLDDGSARVTVGARDRRIGNPEGRCHLPQIWLEGPVVDELAEALGIALPIVSADDVAEDPPERLELSLRRNSARGAAVFTHVAATFGGMIGAALLAFALESWVGGAFGEYAMLLILPGVFIPQILFFTHDRRRPATIIVEERTVTLRVGRKESRIAKEALTLGRGTVDVAAGYGSSHTTPVLSLQRPGQPPVRIGTHDVRLRWSSSTRMRSAHYLLGAIDFQFLAAALGQPLDLDRGAELPPPGPRGRLGSRLARR